MIECQQEVDSHNHPRGTRDVDMGDNFSRKRGEVDVVDESGRTRSGGGDTENRDSAGIPRVDKNDGNRVAQLETGSEGVRGSITEEFQDKHGSGGARSSGYPGNAGLGAKGELPGNTDAGDTILPHGEAQSADPGGDREHSPSNTLGTAYGGATSIHSAAAVGPSEGVAVAQYGDDMGGVTRGDTDGGVQASPGLVATNNLTDTAQYAGAGETRHGEPGTTGGLPRERNGSSDGTAPIDHRRRQSAGDSYDAAVGGAHQADAGNEQRNDGALISPEHGGDGGGGHDDRSGGSEHAPDAPAGVVEQGSTANHAINNVAGIPDARLRAGSPSQTRRPTPDSGQHSDMTLVKPPGDTKYGGPSAVVSIGDGKSRPMQSEDRAGMNGGADGGEAGGAPVEHGGPGGRKKVSFDVGGPDASSTPARPSSSMPPQVSDGGKLSQYGMTQSYIFLSYVVSSLLC